MTGETRNDRESTMSKHGALGVRGPSLSERRCIPYALQ